MLLSFIKEILLLLLIGIITCFLNNSFVVMLILGLGLLLPLIIFWMFSILCAWRFGNISLILRMFLVLLLLFDVIV